MELDFLDRAELLLADVPDDATAVIAFVSREGVLFMRTSGDKAHHLAHVAGSLARRAIEQLDAGGDILDGAEQAGLLVACQDAEALLREALGDG